MKNPGRLCLECRSCVFDMGWAGTDVTPGTQTEFLCRLGLWAMASWDDEAQELFLTLRLAEACESFEETEWARKREGEG